MTVVALRPDGQPVVVPSRSTLKRQLLGLITLIEAGASGAELVYAAQDAREAIGVTPADLRNWQCRREVVR